MALSSIVIEGAQLVLKNFSGEKGRYFNQTGDPEFAVVIPEDMVDTLKADGWNVKQFRAKPDDTEEPAHFLKIKVGMKGRPPRMVLINGSGSKDVDREDCSVFDYVRAKNVDIAINPNEYDFESRGERMTGVSAYLRSLFVTADEDELERKYSNVPNANEEQPPF